VRLEGWVIASIEDAALIGKILKHLDSRAIPPGSRPQSRGPPQYELDFPRAGWR